MSQALKRSTLNRVFSLAFVASALACICAPTANALEAHHYGGKLLSPGGWESIPSYATEYGVGNVATYQGSGQINVCEEVHNLDTGQVHKSCGLNGAGNALNVLAWYGDSVAPFIENASKNSHTIHGYWYSLTDTLYLTGRLDAGEELTAGTGPYPYRLIMQSDGNLVVYNNYTSKACWSSKTNGWPGAYAIMQPDGNLVVYSSGGVSLFDTGTQNNYNARVRVQTDGNLVVYSAAGSPLWASSWVTGQVGC